MFLFFNIGTESISITAETYVGISITGEVTIIDKIINDINKL